MSETRETIFEENPSGEEEEKEDDGFQSTDLSSDGDQKYRKCKDILVPEMPKSPMKGAVAPVVARKLSPLVSRSASREMATSIESTTISPVASTTQDTAQPTRTSTSVSASAHR